MNLVSWNSTTQLTASLTVAPDAAPTARDVTVTNPNGGGSATLTGGFTVKATPPPVTVTLLNPANLNRGASQPGRHRHG